MKGDQLEVQQCHRQQRLTWKLGQRVGDGVSCARCQHGNRKENRPGFHIGVRLTAVCGAGKKVARAQVWRPSSSSCQRGRARPTTIRLHTGNHRAKGP